MKTGLPALQRRVVVSLSPGSKQSSRIEVEQEGMKPPRVQVAAVPSPSPRGAELPSTPDVQPEQWKGPLLNCLPSVPVPVQ